MKRGRQQAILEIIATVDVVTQEQLIRELEVRGFSVTQATISRDIRDLRLVKEKNSQGNYRYTQNMFHAVAEVDVRLRNIFREGVLSVETAQNLVVVKTMPGLASAACSAMDNVEIEGMVGSLAGDDTGVLIMRDSNAAQRFCSDLHELLR